MEGPVNINTPFRKANHRGERTPDPRGGAGLVVVLWVLALMAILVSAFAFDMHLESRILSYYRKRLQAEYLAQAGIERIRFLLFKSLEISGKPGDKDADKDWYADAKRLKQGFAIHGLTDELGGGTVTIDIVPEPARRNVNALTDEDWERIFKVGGVPEPLWPVLIDSFNDWRDGDDEPRMDGAETEDYYARLDPPRKARGHGRPGETEALDTLEELLLIRGFTRQILYGGPSSDKADEAVLMSGIADLLTVTPEAGTNVDVNTASKRVLLTLPGVDDVIADAIIAAREGLTEGARRDEDAQFTSWEDFVRRVPAVARMDAEDRNALQRLVTMSRARILRLESAGRVGGVERRLSQVAQFE